MHPDQHSYFGYTSKARLDKAINSLVGFIEGIGADSRISPNEARVLNDWLGQYWEFRLRHPFNEILPVVQEALADGILTEDERLDICWLAERLRSEAYYDRVTADLQRLHSVVTGICADSVITVDELKGLSEWLQAHCHLRSCWPYDEIDAVVTTVLADKKVDEEEHRLLEAVFSDFLSTGEERSIQNPFLLQGETVQGVYAMCPEIKFPESVFCFTGASNNRTRKEFADIVVRLGGKTINSVTGKLDYPIIGAAGNPCWCYACYGRKVEAAVQLRKEGHHLLLVHENDFNDAVADLRLD